MVECGLCLAFKYHLNILGIQSGNTALAGRQSIFGSWQRKISSLGFSADFILFSFLCHRLGAVLFLFYTDVYKEKGVGK